MFGPTATKARLTCKCGAVNRITLGPGPRLRCGKCKHVWTPPELSRAVPEAPPPRSAYDDNADEPPMLFCKDEEECGWEGEPNEADWSSGKPKCPDCGSKVKAEE